ncbi:MAG: hypothetical protein ACF788_13125 [Novipirellula sp. JB048]
MRNHQMLQRVYHWTAMLVLGGCLLLPCAGCGGSTTDPVGVDESGLEEFEQMQQTEEYIEGERNL